MRPKLDVTADCWLQVRLTRAAKDKLRLDAEVAGVTMSQLVVELIRAHDAYTIIRTIPKAAKTAK